MSHTLSACRACGSGRLFPVLDLGLSPLCESFLTAAQLAEPEPYYPLALLGCEACGLAQLPVFVRPEAIFTDYAYFSSYSESWLRHAEQYVDMIVPRFSLGPDSLAVEVASNDGYLLQYFVRRGIPAYGIEPAGNVAAAAVARGVPTVVEFLTAESGPVIAAARGPADLLIGNNVLAQVPDLQGFVQGCTALLKPDGVMTFEFPHLARLVLGNQFDTIYHEHFSYFSLRSIQLLFERHGLRVFDVEELPTHGGSLRVYGARAGSRHEATPRVQALREEERRLGMEADAFYAGFRERVAETRQRLLDFLTRARAQGKRVAGYGAPGKGNTLLNYCGVTPELIGFTVDRNPHKHGKFLPGSHIPIYPPEHLAAARPDYVLIIPWNLKDEIARQLTYVRDWGGRLAVPIPSLELLP